MSYAVTGSSIFKFIVFRCVTNDSYVTYSQSVRALRYLTNTRWDAKAYNNGHKKGRVEFIRLCYPWIYLLGLTTLKGIDIINPLKTKPICFI
jgi:hypothetical protein